MTDTITFQDGALYADVHGDIWRAITDGTEFLHVKRADENTLDPSVHRWSEDAESVARSFGPMQFITEPLTPAQEAVLLFALQEKNILDDDVRHRALGLLDNFRAETVAAVKADRALRGPLHVDATPLMVTADVEPLVAANVGELLDLLCSNEFFQDFMEIADPSENGGEPADRLQFETLQARLMERMSTRVALTGPQAMRVAGQMAKLAKPLADLSAHTAAVVMRTNGMGPVQRREGGAAA